MKILVADDHKLLREGLKPFLRELADDVVILEAANFQETLDVAANTQSLRMVLLDLSMPGMNGMHGIALLRAQHPKLSVVILSGDSRRETVLGALQAGAAGFIAKTISGAAMVNALRLVLSGETCLPANIADTDEAETDGSPPDATAGDVAPPPSRLNGLNGRDREMGETCLPANIADTDEAETDGSPPDATAGDVAPPPSRLNGLNGRDREILALVVEGLTNKEIGRRIGLQEVTIKAHLRSLYRRIGAVNRAQAVRITLQSQ